MAETNEVAEKKEKKKKKTEFKLCFVNKREAGRSYIQTERAPKTVVPLTPKVFTTTPRIPTPDLNKKVEALKVKGPHEKYKDPVTENMCYGWHVLHIENFEWKNMKCTNPMVKENLMNFEKIRDYI